MDARQMSFRADPLVIGAVGGSGTRVFSRIARHAGVFMGEHVDAQEDSVPLSRFYGEFASEYLAAGGRLDPGRADELSGRLRERVAEHLEGLAPPDRPWGVKNPRSLLMLPFWHGSFPRMRFLHVVRSGLDMSYSATDNQIRRHGESLLGSGMALPRAERAMLWWCRVNTKAADYGEAQLGASYLRVRLEDLCEHPRETVDRLFEFIGSGAVTEGAVAEVVTPDSLGRWRERPAEEIQQLVGVGGEALRRFGYRSPGPG
jgi:hypothetical protein